MRCRIGPAAAVALRYATPNSGPSYPAPRKPFAPPTFQASELRKNIVDFKKDRRVPLGPYATFYFESYETMLAQIQEMLYIEKGGDEQLKDELAAYNPLVPNGKELTATLMFEIDNPISRAAFRQSRRNRGKSIYENRWRYS